jgi:hypothetical protein
VPTSTRMNKKTQQQCLLCFHRLRRYAVDTAKEILAYPPRAMPRDACTCRHGWASLAGTSKVCVIGAIVIFLPCARLPAHEMQPGRSMPHTCYHTECVCVCMHVYMRWRQDKPGHGLLQVPPPLRIEPGGKLVDANSGKPAVLHGVNWFGWHVGSYNFDGLWAFCEQNLACIPCRAGASASLSLAS